jgi:hypothetical protein
MVRRNSLNELRLAQSETSRGLRKLIWSSHQQRYTERMLDARAMTTRPLIALILSAVSIGAAHAEA